MTKRILSIGAAAAIVGAMFIGLEGFAPPGAVGQWWPAGTMAGPHDGSSSVLLRGTSPLLPGDPLPGVLVTGGRDASGPVDSVEIFGSSGFVAAAPMPAPRAGHVAVVLEDGRVLVTGGETSSGATDRAELYDPGSNTWSSAGSMSALRVNHTASLLRDGRVLVAGGDYAGSASASVEIFDPATGEFVVGPPLSTPRTGHAAAVLTDGRVLVAGGSDGAQALDTADLYDASTGEVTTVALLAARRAHSATTLLDGRVLIAGGNDGTEDVSSAEILDPASGASMATGALPAPRSGHVALLLPYNNQVLIAGGSSNGAAIVATALYRSWTGGGEFVATGPLAASRVGATGSPLAHEGWAIVAGGSGLATAETYAFATVKTGKDDYVPDEIVVMTGSGWRSGETITLTLTELPGEHGPRSWAVIADDNGNFSYDGFRPEPHHAGVQFILSALGHSSALRARTTFWDSVATADTSTNFNDNTSQLTISAPANIVGNDVLIAQITAVGQPGDIPTGVVACAPSSDWTSVIATRQSAGKAFQAIFWMRVGPTTVITTSDSFTFSLRTSSCTGTGAPLTKRMIGGIARYTGVVTSGSPIVGTPAGQGGSSSDTATAPAVATPATAGGRMLRFIGVFKDTNITQTAPRIYHRTTSTGGQRAMAAFDSGEQAAASSGTAFNATIHSSGEWVAQTVALRAAPEAPAGPTKLAFTPPERTGTVNQCLASITVQTQNASGTATNVTSNTTVNLATDGTGTFYSDAACETSIISQTIASGASSTTFYYQATARGDGTHQLSASATGLTSATQTQTIDKADQVIAWGAPASITSETALSATQLNATLTTGDGALTYTPEAGTLLTAGTHTLRVDAAATSNYNAAFKEVALIVNKADQVLAWNAPANIIYGTALGATQLNATLTTGNGALTYTPGPGTVLNAGLHTLRVDAAETANYNAAFKTVSLTVEKADQVLAWTAPANIIYETALGATQLNATLTTGDGALTYTPGSGAVLNAGVHPLRVDAAETANYNAAFKTVSLTVEKADQVLAWTAPANIIYGTALGATQLNATLTTGDGVLTYTPGSGTVLNAGVHPLRVDAAETVNYNAAFKTVSLTVEKADQVLAWTPPANIIYGTALGATQLNATLTTGDGALTYTPGSGTVLNAGVHPLRVDAAETANYNAAFKTVSLTVEKADQVLAWTAPANITYGTALGATQLNATLTTGNGALTYTPGPGTVLNAGVHTLRVDAAETANYNAAFKTVSLTVEKALLAVTAVATPTSVAYPNVPAFGVTFYGFVNGENIDVLDGALSFRVFDSENTQVFSGPALIAPVRPDTYSVLPPA
jgi:hypothetical protein